MLTYLCSRRSAYRLYFFQRSNQAGSHKDTGVIHSFAIQFLCCALLYQDFDLINAEKLQLFDHSDWFVLPIFIVYIEELSILALQMQDTSTRLTRFERGFSQGDLNIGKSCDIGLAL